MGHLRCRHGQNPPRPDETYFEIVDTFFEATKLASLLLLGDFEARALQSEEAPPMSEQDFKKSIGGQLAPMYQVAAEMNVIRPASPRFR